MKLLPTRSMDDLENPGYGLWKEMLLMCLVICLVLW